MLEHAPDDLKQQLIELITSRQRCGLNNDLVQRIAKIIDLPAKVQQEIDALDKARQCLLNMSNAMPTKELEIYLNKALNTFKK